VSLRRHYTFDDVSTDHLTIFDEMAIGDFSCTSDITFTSAKFRDGFESPSNSLNAKASCSTHAVYSDMSLAFWMKIVATTSTVTFPGPISNGSNNVDGWTTFYQPTTSGHNLFTWRVFSAGVQSSTRMTLTTGQWYHIVGTVDTANTTQQLYRDGTLIDSTTGATAVITVPSSRNFTIGHDLSPNSLTVAYIQMDDLRVYDEVLTASQTADIITYPTIKSMIKRGTNKGFRRLYMKRKFGADYESEWQRIPDYLIMSWGTVQFEVDDIKPNFYSYSGVTLQVNNKEGYFNDVDDSASFFFGAITRHNTLVKVEAGYTTPGGMEYPTNPQIFEGLLRSDSIITHSQVVDLQCEHMTKIFEEFQSDRITHLRDTLTASEIMTTIRDHQDVYQNSYFQKFITSTSWVIDTTTINYFVETKDLQGVSTWQFMNKIAEADDKTMFMTRQGRFRYDSKAEKQSSAIWHFSGPGDTDLSYGANMQVGLTEKRPISKVRNRISIQYKKPDTVTSYTIKEESAEWGVANSSGKYGVKSMDIENFYMTGTTADSLATALFNRFSEPLRYVSFKSSYVPQLAPNDRVNMTYVQHSFTSKATGASGSFFDDAEWDKGVFPIYKGYNVNIKNKDFKIVKINHDLNSFLSAVEVVEI